MPLTGRNTIDNTPNTGAPFKVLTSFNPDIFASQGSIHGGGDAGFGSLMVRDVATELVMYKPYNNALDTMIQLTGGFETATNSVHEWTENDELLPDEAVGVDAGNANRINGGTYTPGSTGVFVVSEDDGTIFRKGDVVRYAATAGGYVFAYVLDIAAPGSSRQELTLRTFDANLTAASATAKIERMHSLRGSDLNYDVEPRGTIPRQYFTYINKIVHDARYGKRVQNEEHYLNLLNDTERKLFSEMRRSRELQSLYGVKGKFTLANGDVVYSSPGLYNQIADFNKDTAEMTTSNAFDANKFKKAINEFIEFNFGAESGGPDTRTMFVSGKFASYLSQAFEDKQRFYGVEFVAGVRAMRFEHNLGVIDFIYTPVMDYKHPLVGGSLREGTGKAVGMLCPVDECVTRLVMQGEGPSSEVFKERGGDEEENMRVKSTEGLKTKLLQYCAVLEEI
jgi:hypothetical protein